MCYTPLDLVGCSEEKKDDMSEYWVPRIGDNFSLAVDSTLCLDDDPVIETSQTF